MPPRVESTCPGSRLLCLCHARLGELCKPTVCPMVGTKTGAKVMTKTVTKIKARARMMTHGNTGFRGVSNGGGGNRGKGDNNDEDEDESKGKNNNPSERFIAGGFAISFAIGMSSWA